MNLDEKKHWTLHIFIVYTLVEHVEGYQGRSYTDDTEETDSFSRESILKLDIFAMTDEEIAECKKELQDVLERAMQTVVWAEQPYYPGDRDNIPKLSQQQV